MKLSVYVILLQNTMIDSSRFDTPQRQSMIGVIVYLLRHARIIISLGVALIAIGNDNPLLFSILAGSIFLVILFIILLSYLQYKNFTFHVENDELVIHRGVFVKDRKTIPLTRIQSVHIEQNIIQQALGVVGLKIDSAGSKEKELEIAALKEPVARNFRDLLKRKPTAEEPTEDSSERVISEDKEEVLVQLTPIDLLKVGLTENHIRNGLVAVLVVYGYATQYLDFAEDYFYNEYGEYLEDVSGQLLRAGLALIIAGIITFIVISIIISLARTVLKFYDFKAAIHGDVVQINSGLLKKNEYRIPVHKIQYLKWSSNPLRKILGFTTVRLYQVEPGKQQNKKTRIEIPACLPKQARALEALVYEEEVPETRNPFYGDKWAYTRFYSMLFGIPILIWSAVQYFFYPLFWYAPLVLLPAIIFLAYQYGKSVQITYMEDFVVINKGWIFPSRTILSYYKLQAMRFSDNVMIRRRGLAHLTLHTAAGSVKVRYLESGSVKQACTYGIFRIQTSKRSWM